MNGPESAPPGRGTGRSIISTMTTPARPPRSSPPTASTCSTSACRSAATVRPDRRLGPRFRGEPVATGPRGAASRSCSRSRDGFGTRCFTSAGIRTTNSSPTSPRTRSTDLRTRRSGTCSDHSAGGGIAQITRADSKYPKNAPRMRSVAGRRMPILEITLSSCSCKLPGRFSPTVDQSDGPAPCPGDSGVHSYFRPALRSSRGPTWGLPSSWWIAGVGILGAPRRIRCRPASHQARSKGRASIIVRGRSMARIERPMTR